MRIDVHHHFLHKDYMAEEATRTNIVHGPSRDKLMNWTPEIALEAMDRNNIDAAIGSIATPGVWYGDVEAARRLCRRYNESSAGIVQRWPRRFGMFAVIAPPDTDGALSEIEYALDALKADGISIFTNYDGKYPGEPEFAPVFEELSRREATVFVHPTFSVSANALPQILPPLIEFPFDTTRGIVSVITSGMPARYPGIAWIFSHAGGATPMLAGRIDSLLPMLSRKSEGRELHVEGAMEQMRRLYFDVTGASSTGAIAALRALMPVDHILYGSDLPMVDPQADLEELDHSGFTAADRRILEEENARRLLPRLAAHYPSEGTPGAAASEMR